MASFIYKNVYLNDYVTLGGPKEIKGLLKNFDFQSKDYYYNQNSFEKAEVMFQNKVLDKLLVKNKLIPSKVDLLIGGDLINQIAITGYNARNYNIPFLGVYGACATFVESLIIASNFISSNQIKEAILITSSHNLNSEKQYRFPSSYGCPKPERSTFTMTGAVSSLISNTKSKIKIVAGTIGKITDYQVTDPYNLGAAMAPSCAHTIHDHLTDLSLNLNYYDLVLSGDLGLGGSKLLKILMEKEYNIKLNKYLDAGSLVYKENEDCYDGASGPIVLPIVLFNKILKQKKYKKILIVGTGAMHTPVMINQKDTIPGISYAISLEVMT